MASLYKRKNGTQRQLLRVIAGAVMNAAHAHPEYGVDAKFARSVAKRATGTLTAEWSGLALTRKRPVSDVGRP